MHLNTSEDKGALENKIKNNTENKRGFKRYNKEHFNKRKKPESKMHEDNKQVKKGTSILKKMWLKIKS